MKSRRYPPGFFDIPQDISATLPVDIIAEWNHGAQTEEAARAILSKTLVRGTIVSSDSSGLTRLSGEMGLIEILAVINKPKELIYAHGTANGGEGVGIWAADNTQMFYPESIPAEKIVEMLAYLRSDLEESCGIKLGIGAHFGSFYSLGGGLYGPEADAIEEITENHLSGGQVLLSHSFCARLPKSHSFEITAVEEGLEHLGTSHYLHTKKVDASYQLGSHQYPIPYSQPFYEGLHAYQKSKDANLLADLYASYTETKCVVLVEREREASGAAELLLLNELALTAATKKLLAPLIAAHEGEEIKTAGNITIAVFDSAARAVTFSLLARTALREVDIESRTGIDTGPVLLFDIRDGIRDIAGMPVNVASKLAQDKGDSGKIYASASVARETTLEQFTERTFQVSGVEITAYEG
ncbi:MAG: family 3 adenylate cyclase [Patescibacteria group bacterium]